ncbi:Neutral metalloproteinase [Sulfidibacter corallicola]|uniref:Neutral metalloproteinase n=1 Tax=Sulfidibacter corallicola TaxID=2818388 RepID=A0A8A4TQU3_SULCO|nr:M4 family metallopeptidase [Sulfidibacter corallicola]QTD51321.1 M4 family metallopeptidase [Sulfidibacter corallicola]
MKLSTFIVFCVLSSFFVVAQSLDATQTPTATFERNSAVGLQRGVSVFFEGDLGTLVAGKRNSAAQLVTELSVSVAENASIDNMVEATTKTDELGLTHTKVHQYINGLPVVGAEVVVHSDTAGQVYCVNGLLARTANVATEATITGRKALQLALKLNEIRKGEVLSAPKLAYAVDDNGDAFLAYEMTIAHEDELGYQEDRIFVDATGQRRVVSLPLFCQAKNRRILNASGTLLRSEGQAPSSDSYANAIYDNFGITYDYYAAVFGRDSYDDRGGRLTAYVHTGSASWGGGTMYCGDGDGVEFGRFCESLDVVAHEFTHGVTDAESNLEYRNESGALNEAFSDIFGSSCTIWDDGRISNESWMLGEEIYTPGTAGDALRYMDNPTRDNQSYDYYPERYTGTADRGGVHLNSGIANLAYVLLVEGGSHPRGKTTVNVPAIGLQKAQAIFYRTQIGGYLTTRSGFAEMRSASARAAKDLYGDTEEAAVQAAWDAVGAPGGSTGGGCANSSNGTLTGSRDSNIEPNGTYFYHTGGAIEGTLSGPSSADFDLYLQVYSGGWVTVDSSESASSEESISYNGNAGYYRFVVYSYSGSGSYTFCKGD